MAERNNNDCNSKSRSEMMGKNPKRVKTISTTSSGLLLDLLATRTSSCSSISTDDPGQHHTPDSLDAIFAFLEVGELRAVAVTCRTLQQRVIQENSHQRQPCRVIGSFDRLAALFATDRVPCKIVHGPSCPAQSFLQQDELLCLAVFQPQPCGQVCCLTHGAPTVFRRGCFDDDYGKLPKKPNRYFLACGWEKRGKDDDDNGDENSKCDFFQWATAQEQEKGLKHGYFVVPQLTDKTALQMQVPAGFLTHMDQVEQCYAYFRRNYQTGYLLVKKVVPAGNYYLMRERRQGCQTRIDDWFMSVWENTTTEEEGVRQVLHKTHSTLQHASSAAAQAFFNDSMSKKKKDGFVEADEDIIQFFLITYDLAPWLNDNNNSNKVADKSDTTPMHQQILPPQQMLYLGQQPYSAPGESELGKFSLSRDGRTLAVWVSVHNYALIDSPPADSQRDRGCMKVWIFYKNEQDGSFTFWKRPNDILMGDDRVDLDFGEFNPQIVVSADGNMIAGYMSQLQQHYLLQVFDTRIGDSLQPLMKINNSNLWCINDIVQYAFCRENRLFIRLKEKESVLEEFAGHGKTFPSVIDMTVHLHDGEEEDPFNDGSSDATENSYVHCLLPNYEQVKRGQTIYNSDKKNALTYPCRCCGNKFVWTKELVDSMLPRNEYTCTSCSWQVLFPPNTDEVFRADELFHNNVPKK